MSRTHLLLLGGLAALAAAASALLAPQFRVERMSAVGGTGPLRAEAETLAAAFVSEHAFFAGAPRLFLVARDDLAEALVADMPRLATVQVLRRLPGTLELHLQEKVPVAHLTLGGRSFALDSGGAIIAEVPSEEAAAAHLPLIRDEQTTLDVRPGDRVVSERVIALLHDVIVLLPERLAVAVEELVIPAIGSEEVHVKTDAGWRLLLDARRPLEDQLLSLEKAVAEELAPEDLDRLEYVDLRIAGKVYYRLLARPRRR